MKKVVLVCNVLTHITAFHIPFMKRLREQGYQIHVITNTGGVSEIPECDVLHHVCIPRSPFSRELFKALKQVCHIMEKERFDIVHCHTPTGGLSGRIAARKHKTRKKLAQTLGKLRYYTAIHPKAVIADDVTIGAGTVVMANSVINTGSRIGEHCIINTAATVDHDNCIEDFVHLSPGVHLAGTVSVGEGTWFGIGSVANNNISVCAGCTIGAGAVLIKSVSEEGVYVGVPARRLGK